MLKLLTSLPRKLNRLLPAHRRVKGLGGLRGRRLLQLREALHPLIPASVTITDRAGVQFLVTTDPVDARVVNDLTGNRRTMWFPDSPAETVELVLDVGAHHGHYMSAAAQVYPHAEIISVEPALRGVELVRKHVEKNGLGGRVEIVPAAIGAAAGDGTLHHDPSGSWGSSMYEIETDSTERVRLTTLSDVLRGRAPDIIKSNSEGGEFELVPQVLALGLRPSLMVLMVHPEFGDAPGLLRQLESAGFSLESVGTEHRPAYHVRPTG